jgi:glutaredoxin
MGTITLYTTTSCPHCKHLKQYMSKNKISYIERNTDEDDEAMAILVAEDIMSVPTIEHMGMFKVIYSVEELEGFIK